MVLSGICKNILSIFSYSSNIKNNNRTTVEKPNKIIDIATPNKVWNVTFLSIVEFLNPSAYKVHEFLLAHSKPFYKLKITNLTSLSSMVISDRFLL